MRWVWISTGLHIKNVDVNGNFLNVRRSSLIPQRQISGAISYESDLCLNWLLATLF